MSVAADAGVGPAGDEEDEECTMCGDSSEGRGAFLGEYLLNLGPETFAWEWVFEGGGLVFVADTRGAEAATESSAFIVLDTHRRVPYCLDCADDTTSDRGLPPNTQVAVFAC